MECSTGLKIKYLLALLLHVHVKTVGFKEIQSARVLENIPVSTTGRISLVFTLCRILNYLLWMAFESDIIMVHLKYCQLSRCR
jgi:hypothetical protein